MFNLKNFCQIQLDAFTRNIAIAMHLIKVLKLVCLMIDHRGSTSTLYLPLLNFKIKPHIRVFEQEVICANQ